MRSLAFKETALGPRSGSLASNGETSTRECSLRMWVSRTIEKFFCAKQWRRYGRGLRTPGPCGCRIRGRGKVSSHRGRVMGPSDLRRYERLLVEKRGELSSA